MEMGQSLPTDGDHFLSPADLTRLADACKSNLIALLTGATPRYYLAGLPDGNVSGLVLGVGFGIVGEGWQLQRISLNQGLALQASLYQLTQMAAQTLAQRGWSEPELITLSAKVTVLLDPAMHGTAREPDLRGLDNRRRALLLMQGGRTALVYDPRRTAEELLAEATNQLPSKDPTSAAVFSLETRSTEGGLAFSAGPKPWIGPAVRPPAAAGTFYPADPNELSHVVDDLLGPERQPEAWPAAMVPHAGLRFSGRIAAAVFRRLHIPSTVIIVGPKHTALGMDWAVAPNQQWALPGATLAGDPDLARTLARAIPGLEIDAAAHQREHAIEVELPFLARLAPQARIVGLAIGPGNFADCRRIAEGLANVLRQREDRPLLLISSDMNHFAADAETRRLDELALTALERLDTAELHETVTRKHVTMCGVLPAIVVIETLRRLGLAKRAERVGYGTSAEVTGDPSRVVGYAGMLFG
jgi:AmmeMemoRadiSam system protein B